jgi:hypothetical protein
VVHDSICDGASVTTTICPGNQTADRSIERAFVAQRLPRINVAFDDEVGVGQNGFQMWQMLSRRRNCGG